MKRRLLIGGIASGVFTSIAGCVAETSGNDDPETEDPDEDPETEGPDEDSDTDFSEQSEIREITPQIGNLNATEIKIPLDFPSSKIEPELSVVNSKGTTLYSKMQDNVAPVVVEIPTKVLRDGESYTITLETEDQELSTKEITYSGFDMEVVSFDLGVQERSYDENYDLYEQELILKNTGDLPAGIEDIEVTMNNQSLNRVWTATGTSFGMGEERTFNSTKMNEVSGGESEITITALRDDIELASVTTTETIDL